jgi:SGT1 protein
MQEYESRKKQNNVKQQRDDAGGSSSAANQFNLGDIAASMQDFVCKVSSFEGAEVPDNRSSVYFSYVLEFHYSQVTDYCHYHHHHYRCCCCCCCCCCCKYSERPYHKKKKYI